MSNIGALPISHKRAMKVSDLILMVGGDRIESIIDDVISGKILIRGSSVENRGLAPFSRRLNIEHFRFFT